MKRLVSKQDLEKKSRRNKTIMSFGLVLVMLLSIAGFAFQGGQGNSNGDGNVEEKVTYNGVDFSLINGLWVAGVFAFIYNPYEIGEFLTSAGGEISVVDNYEGKVVYIYSEDIDSESEVRGNLGQIASRVNGACVEGVKCVGGFPLKNCEGGDPLIIIKEETENSIRQENNCVLIEGPKEGLLPLTDSFLFKILGVI